MPMITISNDNLAATLRKHTIRGAIMTGADLDACPECEGPRTQEEN